MYLENWKWIGCLPIVSGTIAPIRSPCAVFPKAFSYIPKDVPSFTSHTEDKASSHFGCGSRGLIAEVCWWRTDDGRTAMAHPRAMIIVWFPYPEEVTVFLRRKQVLWLDTEPLTNSADHYRAISETRVELPLLLQCFLMLFLERCSPIHLPHCMTVMSWLGFLIGWAFNCAVHPQRSNGTIERRVWKGTWN